MRRVTSRCGDQKDDGEQKISVARKSDKEQKISVARKSDVVRKTDREQKRKGAFSGLWGAALLIAVQNLTAASAPITDGVFAASLGGAAISTVYVGAQLQALLFIILGASEGALLALGARAYARGEKERFKGTLTVSFAFSAAAAALFTLAALVFPRFVSEIFARSSVSDGTIKYVGILGFSFVPHALSQVAIFALRSVGSNGVGIVVGLLSIGVKALGNLVLIPRMSVLGAAVATVLSRAVQLLAAAYFLLKKDKKIRYGLTDIKDLSNLKIKEYAKFGLPIAASQLVWAINIFSVGAILASAAGDRISAIGIVNTVNSVMMVPISALACAVGVEVARAREVGDGISRIGFKRIILPPLLLGATLAVVILSVRGLIPKLYGVSGEVGRELELLLLIQGVTALAASLQSVTMLGAIRSSGGVRFLLVCDTAIIFLISLPLSLISLKFGAPLWLVFLACRSEQIVKCLPALIRLYKCFVRGDGVDKNEKLQKV